MTLVSMKGSLLPPVQCFCTFFLFLHPQNGGWARLLCIGLSWACWKPNLQSTQLGTSDLQEPPLTDSPTGFFIGRNHSCSPRMAQWQVPPPSESDSSHFPPKRPLLGTIQKNALWGQMKSILIHQTFQTSGPHEHELIATLHFPLSPPPLVCCLVSYFKT